MLKTLLIALTIGACAAVPARRVVNGRGEDENDPRPWTVWLRKGTMQLHCGATLVADAWVLTAASCINNQILDVIAGDNDLTYDEGTEQVMQIANIIIHPAYNKTTFENDIALIQLTAAVTLSDEVAVLPIMSSEILTGIDEEDILSKHCRIAGWGQPELNQFSNPLKELVVDRVDDVSCDSKMADRPSSVLCFHPFSRPELASTCEGDVGGPYMCKIRQVWHLAGVISQWNTADSCTKGIKGATKVLDYAPWIHQYIGALPTAEPIPVEPVSVESTTSVVTTAAPPRGIHIIVTAPPSTIQPLTRTLTDIA